MDTQVAAHSPEITDASWAINFERETIRQKAFDIAVNSRSLRTDQLLLETLEEDARARIRSHNIEPYDPQKNPDDRARDDNFDKLKLDADQQEQAVQHAQVKVREYRSLLAALLPGPEPTLSFALGLFVVTAAVALAATLIPTVVDTLAFTTIFSGTTVGIVAISFGMVFGLFVVASVVLSYRLGRHNTTIGTTGLAGGLVMVVGFLVFRCHMALDRQDYLIAAGLAAIEIGAIVALEGVGRHLRRVYGEWLARKGEYDKGAAELTAAERELEIRKNTLEGTVRQIRAHITYLEERLIRRLRAPELEDAAVRASRDGYLAGIKSNVGGVQAA